MTPDRSLGVSDDPKKTPTYRLLKGESFEGNERKASDHDNQMEASLDAIDHDLMLCMMEVEWGGNMKKKKRLKPSAIGAVKMTEKGAGRHVASRNDPL